MIKKANSQKQQNYNRNNIISVSFLLSLSLLLSAHDRRTHQVSITRRRSKSLTEQSSILASIIYIYIYVGVCVVVVCHTNTETHHMLNKSGSEANRLLARH